MNRQHVLHERLNAHEDPLGLRIHFPKHTQHMLQVTQSNRFDERQLVGEVLIERADAGSGYRCNLVGGESCPALVCQNLNTGSDDCVDRRARTALFGLFSHRLARYWNASRHYHARLKQYEHSAHIWMELPVMTSLPQTSLEIKLKRRSRGLPQARDFHVVEVPLPTVQEGEVLVRNCYSRVSASIRMMISEGAESFRGVPFPVLEPGDTLAGETLGEVLFAPAGSGFEVGDLVRHFLGWRLYAAVPVAECARVTSTLPDVVAHLAHGWTAYAALTRAVQVRSGDTVFITSAAGAIGSMAGQIARLLGASRVIGSTGDRKKADRLISELGYDAIVIRGEGSMVEQLGAAAPHGIDVLLDNVGGEQLQAAVSTAREGARFVLLGALAGQLAPAGTGRTARVELDSFQILLKKLTMRGYSADDDPDARIEWEERFAAGLRSGSITFPHVVLQGIEAGPAAIQNAAEGRYFGTVVVAF